MQPKLLLETVVDAHYVPSGFEQLFRFLVREVKASHYEGTEESGASRHPAFAMNQNV